MDLKDQLEALTLKLEGKSKEEVKSAIDAFELKTKEALTNEVKAVKYAFELDIKKVKEDLEEAYTLEIKKVQDHADKLDIKLKENATKTTKNVDGIKSAIKDNFKEIGSVGDTKQKVKLEVKDMTLGNALTGDQPRDYNYDVVKRPMPIANVEDLATTVPISGGTYTYVRSTLASGAVAQQNRRRFKSSIGV